MSSLVDEKYYEVAPPGGWAERALIRARDRILKDFLERMAPTKDSSILDVGVSDVLTEGANVLERNYAYPQNITACGIGACTEFQSAFPRVSYVQIHPNVQLPFADNFFDIATSNAVLEHVGSPENQQLFVKELARVSKRCFVTVPNRFFPIEHHTAIPLLHFTDRGFRAGCSALNKTSWTNEANLILMTRKKLEKLAGETSKNATVGYTGLKMGPFSSNLYLALH